MSVQLGRAGATTGNATSMHWPPAAFGTSRTIVAVTGTSLVPREGPRRPGDPARIVATGDLAADDLEWKNSHSVREMVESAWASHPHAG